MTREELVGQLRTLGVTETERSGQLALDHTITPETFAARFRPGAAAESVGPLPRIVGAAFGVPVPAMLAMDTVVLGTIAASSGVLVPRGAWSAVPSLLGAVASIVFPTQVTLIFSLVTIVTVPLMLVLWYGEIRSKAPPR